MKVFVRLVISLCLVCVSQQKSNPDSDSYVAAVLEYQYTNSTTINLQNYLYYIQQAAKQDADILVFPEMTLTSDYYLRIPIHDLLKEYRIPALHPHLFDEILVSLSSAAREHGIYLVVNVEEDMDCSNAPGELCPEEKTYIFNTNVVFDRSGAIIDRYRKINLFEEINFSPTLQPDLGIFTTDFGVTFGHFICFDLLFQVPGTQVVQKYNLTDVIYSSMWLSEMPFLTAVEIQEAYAYTMDVNLLSAGANDMVTANAGSGIYSGKAGALISIIPGEPKTKLLVSRVPKRPGHLSFDTPGPIYDDPSLPDNLLLYKDYYQDLPKAVSKTLRPGFQEFVLFDRDVSCVFRARINKKTNQTKTGPHFLAFIKDGTTTYAYSEMGLLYCAVVACQNETAASCPYRFSKEEALSEFEELEITMTTYQSQHNKSLDCDNVVYYPTSLRYNKFPLKTQDFEVKLTSKVLYNDVLPNESASRAEIVYSLRRPQNELVSFGLLGRAYLRDVKLKNKISEEDAQNSHVL